MTDCSGGDVKSGEYVAQALWFPAAGCCALQTEMIAVPLDGKIMVRASFSGISRGTEALVFGGKVPPSEEQRMRAPYMGGDFSFPVKYGYASVGQVIAGPDHLKDKNVFCLHPHQDLFTLPADAATVLPEKLPPKRAVLAANMETALNVVWDAGILPGDKVAVFGAGAVGSMVAFIASRIVGTETLLIDKDPTRRRVASALDIAFTDKSVGTFDVLINASGSADALADAIDHAGPEAHIVEASWHGDKPATLPLGGAFHSRRLSIISSQVGMIPPARRARWDYSRRLAKALELLLDDRLDVLISGETDFAELADRYPSILADTQTLCHCIRY